jgi:DNA mismatch repair protein MutS
VILNESLSSTTVDDALFISRQVLGELMARGSICVCVTFLDELSRLGPQTVSMVATVDPEDLTSRTHKIVRRPADGLAYAQALAEKYSVTYESVRERVAR